MNDQIVPKLDLEIFQLKIILKKPSKFSLKEFVQFRNIQTRTLGIYIFLEIFFSFFQ